MAAKLARFSWLPGGLAAALVIAAGRLLSADAALEWALYDRFQRASNAAASDEVVIVAIDEASIAKLGEWPWPRDVHAQLIEKLHADGARVIAFAAPLNASGRTSESERIRAALALLESSNLEDSQQAQQLRRVLGESGAGRDPDAHLAHAMATHGDVIAPVQIELGEASLEPLDAPSALRPAAEPPMLLTASPARVLERPSPVLLDAASAVGHL
ncbi:MAG TPA: CHASE2 domain-containing protein, partial [Steroidobacter sp.]|nr:CHASE2 domain-containing protein [Steroidobacter sp.]